MSHREYRMYMAWFELEMERPDRADHYAMQIALEVRRVLSKNPKQHKLSDLLLKLDGSSSPEQTEEPTEEELQARAAMAKWAWGARIGHMPS